MPCGAPLLASALGAAAVHSAVRALGRSESFSVALLQLVVGLAVGSLVYPAALWLLWNLAGRPEAIETILGRRIRDALHKLGRRGP
jgi:hypothetical protein